MDTKRRLSGDMYYYNAKIGGHRCKGFMSTDCLKTFGCSGCPKEMNGYAIFEQPVSRQGMLKEQTYEGLMRLEDEIVLARMTIYLTEFTMDEDYRIIECSFDGSGKPEKLLSTATT